jgi:hypothetical protein
MPVIGHPESYYSRRSQDAERAQDLHGHEANKVGQYVTLALEPSLPWEKKLKYFKHALSRHCQPPLYPDDEIWLFYKRLADVVRQYCGHEALRLCSQADDVYAARVQAGQSREYVANDAEEFFAKITGHGDTCPEYFSEDDWYQLKLIRNQWI